jgi:hypothetical protein
MQEICVHWRSQWRSNQNPRPCHDEDRAAKAQIVGQPASIAGLPFPRAVHRARPWRQSRPPPLPSHSASADSSKKSGTSATDPPRHITPSFAFDPCLSFRRSGKVGPLDLFRGRRQLQVVSTSKDPILERAGHPILKAWRTRRRNPHACARVAITPDLFEPESCRASGGRLLDP